MNTGFKVDTFAKGWASNMWNAVNGPTKGVEEVKEELRVSLKLVPREAPLSTLKNLDLLWANLGHFQPKPLRRA